MSSSIWDVFLAKSPKPWRAESGDAHPLTATDGLGIAVTCERTFRRRSMKD
ncbi:hypothetical protein RSSM_01415 [Rhodopirellula sallentina SM41]|uniref:Uncharacterized protein n=1 Tax=Rhodopirellula sallentina SM41 TaxID=1263870 RepID=M5UMA1_9BACT|nr:hypothetical protein RSSM_01415 [Rhodopirellula sallentina SM41]